MKVKFIAGLIGIVILGCGNIALAIFFQPELNMPISGFSNASVYLPLSSDNQPQPDSSNLEDGIDVAPAEILPDPDNFTEPADYFDPNVDLSSWDNYSQDDFKKIALESKYALTRAMALTRITDIDWLKNYALENGEFDQDLTNFEVIAILNNADLDQETFNKIVDSDKAMNDPEFLNLFIGYADSEDWQAVNQDKQIAQQFKDYLDKKEEKNPPSKNSSPNIRRETTSKLLSVLDEYIGSLGNEQLTGSFLHSFMLNSRTRGKLIPQLAGYLLNENNSKEKRINAAIMLETLGHQPYLGEFVDLGDKKSKDVISDLITGLENSQDKDIKAAIAETLQSVGNFIYQDIPAQVETASKLADILKNSSLDKKVKANLLVALREIAVSPFLLDKFQRAMNVNLADFNPDDLRPMIDEVKAEIIPLLKSILTSQNEDPIVQFAAGFSMRGIFGASSRYLGAEKINLADELLNLAADSNQNTLTRIGALMGLQGISQTEAKGENKTKITQTKEKITSKLLNILNNSDEDLYLRLLASSALGGLIYSEISQDSKDNIAKELIAVLKDNNSNDEVLKLSQDPFLQIAGPIGQYYTQAEEQEPFNKDLIKNYIRESSVYSLTNAISKSELSADIVEQAVSAMLDVFKDPAQNIELINVLGKGISFLSGNPFMSPELKEKFVNGLLDIFKNPYDFNNLSPEEQDTAKKIMVLAAGAIGNGLNKAGIEDTDLKQQVLSVLSDFIFKDGYGPEIRYWAEYPLAVLAGDPKISTGLKQNLAEKLKDYIKTNLENPNEAQAVKGALGIITLAFRDHRIGSDFKLAILDELNIFGEKGIIKNPQVDNTVKSASLAIISSLISDSKIPLEKKQAWAEELLKIMEMNPKFQPSIGSVGGTSVGGDEQEGDWFDIPTTQEMAGVVLSDIAARDDVSHQVKESLVTDILKFFDSDNRNISTALKYIAGNILMSIAQDKNVSIDKKMEIFNGIKDELTDALNKSDEEFAKSERGFQAASIMEGLLRDSNFVNELSKDKPDYLKNLAGEIITKFNQIKDELVQKGYAESKQNIYGITENNSAYISLLARIAKNSEQVKNMVNEGFNLAGTQKEIFANYGVLVLNGWGEFSQKDYESIKNVLSQLEQVFGKEKVKELVNTVIRMYYDPNGILGAAYPNGTTWLFGDLHNYPIPGGEGKKADIFEEVLFHELAHHIDFNILNQNQHDLFKILHFQSGYDPDNYSRLYGITNKWEDFATMLEAWGEDSKAIIAKAKNNSDPALLRKVLFTADLFTFNNKVYLFRNVNGHIEIDQVMDYADFIKMVTGISAD